MVLNIINLLWGYKVENIFKKGKDNDFNEVIQKKIFKKDLNFFVKND